MGITRRVAVLITLIITLCCSRAFGKIIPPRIIEAGKINCVNIKIKNKNSAEAYILKQELNYLMNTNKVSQGQCRLTLNIRIKDNLTESSLVEEWYAASSLSLTATYELIDQGKFHKNPAKYKAEFSGRQTVKNDYINSRTQSFAVYTSELGSKKLLAKKLARKIHYKIHAWGIHNQLKKDKAEARKSN